MPEVQVPDTSAEAARPTDTAMDVLQKILDILQKSTIANRDVTDPLQRFWNAYRATAEEFDTELLEKYSGDINMCMIFAGLFSAVDATVLAMTNPNLSQDPNVITQALLQSILISLNTSAASAPLVPAVPVWTGPSPTVIWVQSLLYISLACSLFAALAAVLGMQWLSHYRSVGERGDAVTRAMERHRKFTGLETWHLRAILVTIPLLLQLALLLFGLALCAYVWGQQRVVGAIAIVVNGIGALSYIAVILISVVYKDSPFQTPLTTIIRRSTETSRSALITSLPSLYAYIARLGRISRAFLQSWLGPPLRTAGSAMHRWFSEWMGRLWKRRPRSRSADEDEERVGALIAQQDSAGPPVALTVAEIKQNNVLSSTTAQDELLAQDELPAFAVLWLLNTTTDMQVRPIIWRTVHMIHWPPRAMRQLPIDALDRAFMDVRDCFERSNPYSRSSLGHHDASAAIYAFLFLFWEKLADSYEETAKWVRRTQIISTGTRVGLSSMFRDSQSIEEGELKTLCTMFNETIVHISSHGVLPGRPLRRVASLRSCFPSSVDMLFARSVFYLAWQASILPNDRTLSPRDWATEEVKAHRRDILIIALDIMRRTDSEAVLVTLAIASVIPTHADPLTLERIPQLFDPENNMKAVEFVLGAIRDNLLHQLTDNREQGISLPDWVLMNHITSPLQAASIVHTKLPKYSHPVFATSTSKLQEELQDLCLQVLAALFRIAQREPTVGEMPEWRQQVATVCSLFFYSVPPACCPDHACGGNSLETCTPSKERVPTQRSFESLQKWAEDQLSAHFFAEFLFSAYRIYSPGLEDILYAVTVLFSLPERSVWSIPRPRWLQNAILSRAEDSLGYTVEHARATMTLIHMSLDPEHPSALPLPDFISDIGLPAADVYAGICAILRQATSEPFFSSRSQAQGGQLFLSPDEMASDILLWMTQQLGGLSNNVVWRDKSIPLWLYIAWRALFPHYDSRSRKAWQVPSERLRNNIRCLMTCDALFGGANSEMQQRKTQEANAQVEEADNEFWQHDAVRCLSVAVVDISLLGAQIKFKVHPHEDELTASKVLDRAVQALAQLRVENVSEVKDHLESLRRTMETYRNRPASLFAWVFETVDEDTRKAAEDCAPVVKSILARVIQLLSQNAPFF